MRSRFFPAGHRLPKDVVFGRGHTRWKFTDTSATDAGGWQTVLVDPDVVAARVVGLSFGFCLWDVVTKKYY